MTYKLFPTDTITNKPSQYILRSDGAIIPFAPDNTDYQAYLAWLAEGNTPEAAE